MIVSCGYWTHGDWSYWTYWRLVGGGQAWSVVFRVNTCSVGVQCIICTVLYCRLLMPGPGRWRCVSESMVGTKVTPVTIIAIDEPLMKGGDHTEWDAQPTNVSKLCLGADGTVKTVDDVFR